MNLNFKTRLVFSFIGLSLIIQSCCFGVKEKYLGNKIYLSEFDNVDRRILYQENSCAMSGIEIVPMTVIEIAYDTEWIIAKSENKLHHTNIKYWIIKNYYNTLPDAEAIKENTTKFSDYNLFKSYLEDNNITIQLKAID
jgi:hypothetical protein